MDKPIKTLDDLQGFCKSTIKAIPEISKVEAYKAIDKAFSEFREDFGKEIVRIVNDSLGSDFY